MQEKQQIPINLTVNLEEKDNKEDTSNKLLLHYSQNAVDIQKRVIQSLFLFDGAAATATFASKNEDLLFPALWFAISTMVSIWDYMLVYDWQVSAMADHIYNHTKEEAIAKTIERRIVIVYKVAFALSFIGIIITWICLWK